MIDLGETPRSESLRQRGLNLVLGSAVATLSVAVLLLLLFGPLGLEPPLPQPWSGLVYGALAASFVPAPFGLALIFWAGRLDKLERGRRGIRLPLGISLFANHSGKITFIIVAGAIALVSISGDIPHRFVPIVQFGAFVFVGICAVVALVIKALRTR